MSLFCNIFLQGKSKLFCHIYSSDSRDSSDSIDNSDSSDISKCSNSRDQNTCLKKDLLKQERKQIFNILWTNNLKCDKAQLRKL